MTRLILALAAMVALTTAALAHSKTDATTPAEGATVDTVEVIAMRFDDPMRITAITLTGPDGEVDLVRETGFDPVMEFRGMPGGAVAPGAYTVEWRGLASDGHPMQGSFGFTVAD
ncbi:MAG: copper resistance CopC family protein [Pseudomonadota bacterium]